MAEFARLCPVLLVAVLLATLGGTGSQAAAGRNRAGRAGGAATAVMSAPGPAIKVPVRWCGLQGSPTMSDPTLVGETTTNDVLIRRLQRASTNVTFPQTGVLFRSGATEDLPDFPIIPDPAFPGGEVIGGEEAQVVFNACRKVWQDEAPGVFGVTAINVKLINGGAGFLGFGGSYFDFCSDTMLELAFSKLMLVDNASILNANSPVNDPVDKVLAHELSHSLCLNHGDGANADDDGRLDEDPPDDEDFYPGDPQCPGVCGFDDDRDGSVDEGNVDDDDEDGLVDEDGPDPQSPDCATNMMCYEFPAGPAPDHIVVTPGGGSCPTPPEEAASQQHVLRCQATLHIPDREIEFFIAAEPPAQPAPPSGDLKVDDLFDVPSGDKFIDIDGVAAAVEEGTATYAVSTLGEFPASTSGLRYLFLADLDDNAATGGSAAQVSAEIGLAATLPGVDLIGEVVVDVSGDIPQSTAAAKR